MYMTISNITSHGGNRGCYDTAGAGLTWMTGYKDAQEDFQHINGHALMIQRSRPTRYRTKRWQDKFPCRNKRYGY